MLIRNRQWESQPVLAEASSEWPLAFLCNGTDLIDRASGNRPVSVHSSVGFSNSRLASLDFNGSTGYVAFPSRAVYNVTKELTIVWVGKVTDYAKYNVIVSRNAGDGATNNPFALRTDLSSGKLTLLRSNASGYYAWETASAIGTDIVSVVITHKGDTTVPKICINGVTASMLFWVSGGGDGSGTSNNEVLYLGYGNSNYHKGSTALLGVLPMLCSPDQLISLSRNPWQLLSNRRLELPAYQPADSILVPPYLSNPGVTNITTTGAQPVVKVEY